MEHIFGTHKNLICLGIIEFEFSLVFGVVVYESFISLGLWLRRIVDGSTGVYKLQKC